MNVNLTEAAKLAGISRNTLYKKLKNGVLSAYPVAGGCIGLVVEQMASGAPVCGCSGSLVGRVTDQTHCFSGYAQPPVRPICPRLPCSLLRSNGRL